MNIVKIQEVTASGTKSNSTLHKENQNIMCFSPHNHFELMQRILNLKFVSKIIQILGNFVIHCMIINLFKYMSQNFN